MDFALNENYYVPVEDCTVGCYLKKITETKYTPITSEDIILFMENANIVVNYRDIA